jgi:hypothetical protein
MLSPTDNGNETGAGGGLSGSDLVLTRGGDMPRAWITGMRVLNGGAAIPSTSYLLPTTNARNLIAGSTWGLLFELENIDWDGAQGLMVLIPWSVNSGNGSVRVEISTSTGVLTAQIIDKNGNDTGAVSTTNAIPQTGKIYIAIWADGSSAYAAFKSVSSFDDVPSSSDFAVNDTATLQYFDLSGVSLNSTTGAIGGYIVSLTNYYPTKAEIGTVVISKLGYPTK